MVDGMIDTECVRRVHLWDDRIFRIVLVTYRDDPVGITSLLNRSRCADLREPGTGDPSKII